MCFGMEDGMEDVKDWTNIDLKWLQLKCYSKLIYVLQIYWCKYNFIVNAW